MFKAVRLGSIIEVDAGSRWTGETLAREVARRVHTLEQYGVGPGTRVLILHGGTRSFFADLLATWELGACAVCADPGLSPPERQVVLDFVEPAAILRGDGDISGREVPGRQDQGKAGSVDDPALILFTSGTTGAPKGVTHTFRGLMSRVALNRQFLGREVLRNTLCVLPTHFGHGLIGNCLTPLLGGDQLILAPGMGVQRAAALSSLIDDHEVTFLSSVPTLWKIALRTAERPRKGSLRRINVGSAPFSADLWNGIIEWAGCRNVANMYGITETANWIAGGSAVDMEPKDGLVGTMWGGNVAVRDDTGRIRSTGDGEILVQTPAVMKGYYQRPEATREVFQEGWFRTGDIGTVDGNGTIRLTGRKKHEINRAGIKIHPEDLDLLLEKHPAVAEACAFGIADEIAGEVVGVALRLMDGADVAPEDLRLWCRDRLRHEAIPERWYVLPRIPKTDRGKINRDQVRGACIGGKS